MLSLYQPRNRSSNGCWGAVLALLAAGLVTDPAAWAQDEKLPAGEKIMEKSIEGRGGREAFEKIKSRVSKGTIEGVGGPGAQKGTVTVYEAAPNKRYFLVELPGGIRIEAGSDGDTYWEIAADGPKIFEGEEKAQKEREATFNALLHWKELYQKVECVGKEQVGDHSCYKVVLTPNLGKPETIYFDRKNGYPVRTDVVRKVKGVPSGELPIQIDQEDYKQIDGVWLPHKLIRHIAPMNQPQTITYTWESIEHNVDIPADRFDLPQEIKDLQANPAKKPGKPAPKSPPG
jgi:outer membrane lipoprotein-sorting protein